MKNETVGIIYHNADLDGLFSYAILANHHKITTGYGWNYGYEFIKPKGFDRLYLVDISYPTKEMFALCEDNNQVIWIDHHKTAIDDYKKLIPERPKNFTAVINNDLAAIELTWEEIHGSKPMPRYLQGLAMYDVFRHRDGPFEVETNKFQLGARLHVSSHHDAKSVLAAILKDPKVQDDLFCYRAYFDGAILYRYNRRIAEKAFDMHSVVEIGEFKFATVNIKGINPGMFNIDYRALECDGTIVFHMGEFDRWFFGLYSEEEEVDCGALAKEWYGGGGHKGAAGFELSNWEFSKFLQTLS